MPPDVHYLNCAYMSPLSLANVEAGIQSLKAQTFPAQYEVEDFFAPVERAKSRFADLLGNRDPERIAIIPSASYGIANAAANAGIQNGDNVVIAEGQFPSNYYPWDAACKRVGASMRVVPKPATAPGWTEELVAAIDSDTRVVSVGHVHWADGTVFDLVSIAKRAREVDALVVIDGTQSIGVLPFPYEEIKPDAVICASYKWLLGPYGIGAAYYGPHFDGKEPIEHNWINRKDSDNFRALVDYTDLYRPKAHRFSVGENSNFMHIPLFENSLKLLQRWSAERIYDYCQSLVEPYLENWERSGFELLSAGAFTPHLFGLGMPEGVTEQDVREVFGKYSIYVSFRGKAIRVAPYVYNDTSDMEALTQALEELGGA